MIINTFCPKTTDSYRAAKNLMQNNSNYDNDWIVLYPSFEKIYHHLDQHSNELFLVPAAYQSHTNNENWGSNNYHYWQQLKIIDTFHLPTMPIILVENHQQKNHRVALHAATEELINQFQDQVPYKLNLNYVTSKPLAKDEFETGNYQYAIFSKNNYQESNDESIIQEYKIEMVWCLYQIKP